MTSEKKISIYQERFNHILNELTPDQAEEFDPVLEPISIDAKSLVESKTAPAVLLKFKHYTIDFWTRKNQHFKKILAELNELLLELPENTRQAQLRKRLVEVVAIIDAAKQSIELLLPNLIMRESQLKGNTVAIKKNEESMHEPVTNIDSIDKKEKKEKKSVTIPDENKLCSPFPVNNQRELAAILDKKTKLELLDEVIPIQALNPMVLEYCDPVVMTLEEVLAKLRKGDKDFSLCNFSPMDSAGCHQPIDLQKILGEFDVGCFDDAVFAGALLNEIDLSKFLLRNIDFTNAVLKGARLKHCVVQGCIFVNADLSHARLYGTMWDNKNNVAGANLDRIECDGKSNLLKVNLTKIASMHFFRVKELSSGKTSSAIFQGDGDDYVTNDKFLQLIETSLAKSVTDDELARSLLFEIMRYLSQEVFNKPMIDKLSDLLNRQDSAGLYAAAKELAELESQQVSTLSSDSSKKLVKFLGFFEKYTGAKASAFLNYYSQERSQFRVCLTSFDKEKPEWLYAIQLAAKEGDRRGQYTLGAMYGGGYGLKRDRQEAFRLYDLADKQGEPLAAFALGYCYLHGRGVKRNLDMALNCFQRAAGQGYNRAEVEVGKCYFSGWGVNPDKQYAFNLFYELVVVRQVAEPSAKFELGRCYEQGQGVKKDLMKAISYYQIAAKEGNDSAQYRLGELYELGVGVEKNWHKAIDLYQQSATLGNIDALLKLGRCYQYGYGVDRDLKEAFKLYQLSAEMGNADGQLEVGLCYEEGRVVEQNLKEAFRLYQLVAEQKLPRAQYQVACCYQYGRGVDQDVKQAFKFYQLAAEQHNQFGQYKLGYCYEFGMGVNKDLKQAHKYYCLAAQQGDELAQLALGQLYEFDHIEKDVTKDLAESIDEHLKEAIKYYRLAIMKQKNWLQYALIQPPNITSAAKYLTKAIELCRYAIAQGSSGAQVALGHCYVNGLGVPKDLTRAVKLFQLAADQNNRQAQCMLGLCYEIGRGVAKDLSKAAENYRHALEEEPKKSIFASSAVLFPPPSSASLSSAQPPTSTSSFVPGQ